MESNEKQTNRVRIGKLLGGFVLIAVLLFLVGGSILFRVQNVVITGTDMYTEEEILKMSGVNRGDHLFFVSASKISANLMSAMDYAQAVRVSRQLPDTLCIEITEAIPAGVVQSDGKWIIDQNCRVLSKVTGKEGSGLPVIRGLTLCTPVVGEYISEDGEEQITAQLLGDVLCAIANEDMTEKISWLEAEGTSHIVFLYDDRLEVQLGSAVHAQEKLALMTQVLGKLEPDDAGTLDLSVDGEARFIPDV